MLNYVVLCYWTIILTLLITIYFYCSVILKPRHNLVPTPAVSTAWNCVSLEDIAVPEVDSISKDGFPPLLPLHNSIVISNEIIKSTKPAERVLLLKRIEAMEKKTFK